MLNGDPGEPATAPRLLERGYAALQARRPADAAAFHAAARIDPGWEEPFIGLSTTAAAECEWTSAVSFAEQAVSAAPRSYRAAERLAQALIDDKAFTAARRFLSKALNLYPDQCALPGMAGMLELENGDPFAGLLLIETSVARGLPFWPHIYSAAVTLMCFLGQFARAQRLVGVATPEQGASLLAQIRTAQERWIAGEARCPPGKVKQEALTAALAEGELPLASHLVRRLFASPDATSADYLLVSGAAAQLSARGFQEDGGLTTKGHAAAMLRPPVSPLAALRFADDLILRRSFGDAGALYLSLVDAADEQIDPSELLRMLLLCLAAGAIDIDAVRAARRRLGARIADAALLHYADNAIARFAGEPAGGGAREPAATEDRAIRRAFTRRPLISPRIALCLSGQLRGYAKAWEQTRRALEHADVTVFVATWPRTGSGIGTQGGMDRVLPPGLYNRLPPELRSREIIEERYPSLYRLALAAGAAVDKAELSAFYETGHVLVLDEEAFEARCAPHPDLIVGNSLNQAKMYYAMHACLAARAAHEAAAGVFDVVIRNRPDRTLEVLSDRDLAAVHDRRVCRTDHFYGWAVGDQTGIMSSAVADEVEAIWPAIWNAKRFACFPGASGRAAEWLMGEVLVGRGVAVERLGGTRLSGLLSTTIEPMDVLVALLADIASGDQRSRDDLSMLDATVSAIIELGDERQIARAMELVGGHRLSSDFHTRSADFG